MRRVARALAAMTLAGGLITMLGAQPAQASDCTLGIFCGKVTNRLPSSFTVKVAVFGEGSESCATLNSSTFTCRTYWLPSNKTSKDIGVKDVDGFMVENSYWRFNYYTINPPGGWWRISDGSSVICQMFSGDPYPNC